MCPRFLVTARITAHIITIFPRAGAQARTVDAGLAEWFPGCVPSIAVVWNRVQYRSSLCSHDAYHFAIHEPLVDVEPVVVDDVGGMPCFGEVKLLANDIVESGRVPVDRSTTRHHVFIRHVGSGVRRLGKQPMMGVV
jgi:hypothetical protein